MFVPKISFCPFLHKDLKINTHTHTLVMVPGLYIGLRVGFLLWGNNIPSALNVFSTNHTVTTHYHLLLCGMRVSKEKHVVQTQ